VPRYSSVEIPLAIIIDIDTRIFGDIFPHFGDSFERIDVAKG
jgi:hypothetical protein